MEDALVEVVARRLAEFEGVRQHKDRRFKRTSAGTVTEIHRAKARIAIAMVDRFRRKGTQH